VILRAERLSVFCVRNNKLAHPSVCVAGSGRVLTRLEGKFLESNGQTRHWLVPGAGLCDNGDARGGTPGVAAGDLDAVDVCRLVGCALGGSGGVPASLGKAGTVLPAEGKTGSPRQS
jgi:hypothetical protein